MTEVEFDRRMDELRGWDRPYVSFFDFLKEVCLDGTFNLAQLELVVTVMKEGLDEVPRVREEDPTTES